MCALMAAMITEGPQGQVEENRKKSDGAGVISPNDKGVNRWLNLLNHANNKHDSV